MFLDESGDHNLTVIDPQYPLFALGGVIMDLEYAENTATERIRDFKLEYFDLNKLNFGCLANCIKPQFLQKFILKSNLFFFWILVFEN